MFASLPAGGNPSEQAAAALVEQDHNQASPQVMTDSNKKGSVICWLRRDLRLDDNPALHAALATGRPVVVVFVWAPEEEGQFQQGRYSRWWTKQSVIQFQSLLEHLGSRLIIRRAAESKNGLMQVVHDIGAQTVFFNHLYDPISLVRDHEVKNGLIKLGIECKSFNADLLYEPWEVLDDQQQPFTSFEPFWARVMAMPVPPPFPLPAPQTLPAVDAELFSVPVQELDWFMTPEQEASSEQLKFKWRPGVEGAVEKLEAFLGQQLHAFEHDRAKVDRSSTSQLSPWIHSGTISVRYIFYRVCQLQAELRLAGTDVSASCKDFLQQLGYREYSRYLSFHFPFIHERSLLSHLRACPWRMDQKHFKAWRQGQTGYPLVDAAMRELWSTGWCHNRMRVVAASFMVKNLLLPWQWGLKHYWDAQMDADLECDALGWQYVSGGMADAHPFARIIDLDKEASRFDPDGEYVRRWLPVLARLPTKYIHTPWLAPQQVLYAADVELGYTYQERIITAEASHANMAEACKVLESCASNGSKSNHPYRPSTVPNSGTGPSGPSTGTGTGGKFGTGDGTVPKQATGQGGSGAAAAPAGGEAGGSGAARGAAAVGPPGWSGRQQPREVVVAAAAAAASQHSGPRGGVRPRGGGRQRAQQWQMHSCGAAEDDEGQEGEEGQGGQRWMTARQVFGFDDSSCSDDMSDDAVSEEVVSNTVGLSAPQASAWSGLPADDEVGSGRHSPRSRRAPSPPAPAATRPEAVAGMEHQQQQQYQQMSDAAVQAVHGSHAVQAVHVMPHAEKRPASPSCSPADHDKRKAVKWSDDAVMMRCGSSQQQQQQQQQQYGSSGMATQTPYPCSAATASGSVNARGQQHMACSADQCMQQQDKWGGAGGQGGGQECGGGQGGGGGQGVAGVVDMDVDASHEAQQSLKPV